MDKTFLLPSDFVVQSEFWKFIPEEKHTDRSQISFLTKLCEEMDQQEAKWSQLQKQRTLDKKLSLPISTAVNVATRLEKMKKKKRPRPLFSSFGMAYPCQLNKEWVDSAGEE